MINHIANYRYVVVGERDDGRRWAIHATDVLADAQQVLQGGRTVNGQHWTGVHIRDRRTQPFGEGKAA